MAMAMIIKMQSLLSELTANDNACMLAYLLHLDADQIVEKHIIMKLSKVACPPHSWLPNALIEECFFISPL